MKRLLAILLLIVSFNSFAQNTLTRPSGTTFQQMGSSATWLQQNGIGYAVVGFVNSNYDDTTAANGNQFAKQTAGTQIYTTSGGGKLWIRNSTATRWLEVSTGSSSATNSNVGSAFRLAIPNTNNIKTLSAGYGITMDSATTNQIGVRVDTTTLQGMFWGERGNAGTNNDLDFIGTTDAQPLRFKVNNLTSGYIGVSYQLASFGYQTGIGVGGANFGWNAAKNNVDEGVTAIGNGALQGTPNAFRSTIVGYYAHGGYISSLGSALENSVLGAFGMELNMGGDYNGGFSSNVLRSNKDGSYNNYHGHSGGLQNTTNIASIVIATAGSGQTDGTHSLTITAPQSGSPGGVSTQATATVTIAGGIATSVSLTNRGAGYSSVQTITATISQGGTPATFTVTLQSGDGNSGLGHAVMAFNRTGDYSAALGYNAGMGAGNAQPSFDNSYMLYLGTNATSIPDTGLINGSAIGPNSFIGQSNAISLGDTTVATQVGIGTAYPTALLDVTGTLRFRNGATNGYILSTDGSGNATWVNPSSIVTTTPTLQQVFTAGSMLIGNNTINGGGGTNELIFNNNSKFLAASGSGAFDVNDINAWNKSSYGQSDLTLKTDSAGLTVANQLRVYIGNTKFWINPFNQDNDFIVETTNDTAAIFVDAGNDRVGIGTATPSTKLHVNGGFRLVDGTQQSGYVLTSDANGVGTWQAAAGGGGTPAGNFGNLQINRNGAFATPASDSLTFLSTGFTSVAGAFSLTGGGARVYGNDAFGGAILRYGAGDAHAVTIQVGTITLSTNFNTRLQLVDASTTVSNRFRQTQGADVASAAGAIALGSDGNSFEITGTAAITLISNVGWQNGSKVTLLFTSTATLTDGTANSGTDIGMELAGNTNFTGSAGATITLLLSEIGGVQRYREVARSVN
jgi:hypothetical protein